jgi:hypothetical protein
VSTLISFYILGRVYARNSDAQHGYLAIKYLSKFVDIVVHASIKSCDYDYYLCANWFLSALHKEDYINEFLEDLNTTEDKNLELIEENLHLKEKNDDLLEENTKLKE